MNRIVLAIFVLLPLISSCSTTPTATPQPLASATSLLTTTPTATSTPIATATSFPTATSTVTPTATPVPITVNISHNLEQAHENGFQLLAGHPPFTVNFSAKVTGGRGKLTYTWDFKGDGTIDSTDLIPQPFTYTTAGEYSASLTVRDESGQKASAQQRIVVIGKPNLPKWKYGVNAHLNRNFGLYKTDGEVEKAAQMIRDVGIQCVRVDMAWYAIQPQRDSYKWDDYDYLVGISRKYGFELMPILDYSSEWASTGKTGTGTTWRDWMMYAPITKEYAWYAYKAVERYKDSIHAWEVWNEPNNTNFWMPKPDPVAYSNLLRQTYLAIKYADPTAVVILGGLTPVPVSDPQPDSFLRVLYEQGGKAYFDVVGSHPYAGSQEGVPVALKRLADVRNVMISYGDREKPIWVTEYNVGGGATFTDEFQGNWLTQSFDAFASLGYVPVIFWFKFRNITANPNDWVENAGLVKYDWTLKPAYKAYKDYIATHP